jgi:hypothetical protein
MWSNHIYRVDLLTFALLTEPSSVFRPSRLCMDVCVQGYHARYDQDAQAAADKAGSETHPQVQADHPQAAAAAGAADDSWPSDEVLSQRVRQLFTLLAQAVVLAESQGLLMPLPGEGLALTERLLQLPPSAGYVAAGASFFHESLWQEDEDAPLEDLLCADDGSDSSDSDQDAHGYAAYGRGRGRGRRGRGRGRGRGRTSKAERLAAEAAAFGAMVMPADKAAAAAAEDEGDEGGFGRRRVHRPNSRYADHVLIPVVAHEGGHQHGGGGAAYHAGGSSHQSEVGGRLGGWVSGSVWSLLGVVRQALQRHHRADRCAMHCVWLMLGRWLTLHSDQQQHS